MLIAKLALSAALLQLGWLPTGVRWNTAQFPIRYCITANATNTNLSATAQRNAVIAAINSWVATGGGGSLSCTTYSAAASTQTCQTQVNGNDGRYNIFWNSNWQQGSQTIGVTWSTGSGQGCGNVTDDSGQNHQLQCKFDSDIEFNNVHFFWDTTGNNTDVQSIATHEYGHFVGLDHCSDNNTCGSPPGVMTAFYPGGTVRALQNDDIQGGCALYPGTPGGLGWPCSQNSACTSNLCLNPGAGGYCSQTCAGTCPTGYACGANPAMPSQMVCLRDDGLNKGQCEVCQPGAPTACSGGGLCMQGLAPSPSPDDRCVMPCRSGMVCDSDYQCLAVQNQDGSPAGNFCFPRSNNCDDPGNFVELTLGQRCNGNPPCASNLTCVGICAPACMPGTCPADWGCETFQGGEHYCLPGVREGQSCEGLVSCAIGPCLTNPTTHIATCYKDCAGNPSACNNAQECNTYSLQGGGSVSICEQPGVPPLPPDAGVNTPDSGPNPNDSGVNPGQDGGVNPGQDGGVNPGQDGGVGPGADGGNMSMMPAPCECDLTFGCDNGCQACDPECACACDVTFGCDNGCESCDPECKSKCACTSVPGEANQPSPAWAMLLLGLLALRRRR